MSILSATVVETSMKDETPRVYAPAEARVRKDALPWDADLLSSRDRHERTHAAPSTHAPVKGRVRRDAMPWDVDLIESCDRHGQPA
jgi:hypothetical protein